MQSDQLSFPEDRSRAINIVALFDGDSEGVPDFD